MAKHTFSVKASENASKSYNVTVNVPDTFTEAQTTRLIAKAISSVTINVQGTLRRRIKGGTTDADTLAKEAQAAFDAVINGVARSTTRTVEVVKPIDVGAMFPNDEASAEQMAVLKSLLAQGAKLSNIPTKIGKALTK